MWASEEIIMLLNADLSLDEKIEETRALAKKTPTVSTELVNRLFFQARNGAISALLRAIEQEFVDHKMVVRAQWREHSMGGPTIALVLVDPRTGEHERHVQVDRSTVGHVYSSLPSQLVYKLNTIQVGAYYASRKPKAAEAFDAILATPGFKKKMAAWINGANYPFTYESQSSF